MTRALAVVALVGLLLLPAAADAHYHMLLPDKPSAKTGETVTFTYQYGHPFEHELSDAKLPVALFAISPDGKKIDLAGKLEKVSVDGGEGKKVNAYRFSFTPEKRGDYVFAAIAAPETASSSKRSTQDLVKTIVHVQTQNGWTNRIADPELGMPDPSPLTRPYGIEPGMAFQIEVEEATGKGLLPLPGIAVEIERFNATPPKSIPDDEMITRVVRTDRSGTATATLTSPGWWCLTAIRDKGDVRQRATFWVHVSEKAGAHGK